MKKAILFLLSIATLTLSCGKDGAIIIEPKNIASFSYNGHSAEDAMVSVNLLEGNILSIYIAKFDGNTSKGEINIVIDNYKGPGRYEFGENVKVTADEGTQEAYWDHDYYNDNGDHVYGTGTVIIDKYTNDKIKFTLNGTLNHSDGLNPKVETTVKADVDKYR